MKRSLLFLSLFSFLLAHNINEEFQKKYLSNVSRYTNDTENQQVIEDVYKSEKNVKILHFDENNTKSYLKGVVFNNNQQAKIEAESINKISHSNIFQKNIKNAELYILDKKGFNYQKYLGQYTSQAYKVINDKYKENKYLFQKEKVYIVISSSMPEETIRNYFRDIQNIRTDIVFVMRGVIGSISRMLPTLKWIRKILTKPDCIGDDKKCFYKVNLVINPKVTEYFNIKEVPAVIFLKNYDGFLNRHIDIPKKTHEKAYIAYGDANLKYALEAINKYAQDKGLSNLIKNMHKSYFLK